LLPAGDDAVGFVTKVYFNTTAVGAEVAAQMVARRRHGLVISEWDDLALFDPKLLSAYSMASSSATGSTTNTIPRSFHARPRPPAASIRKGSIRRYRTPSTSE